MGPRNRPVPLGSSGGSVDNVARMRAILARLEGQVDALEWVPPPLGSYVHALTWTERGKPERHEESDLGRLARWAEGKWPA